MRSGDWILQSFSEGRSPRREVTNVADALRVLLVESGGSVSALARELGRPRRTVRNWLAGVTPRDGGGGLVAAAVRAQRRSWMSAELEDELRNGFETVSIGGTISISADSEPRHIVVEFISGWGDQLVDAYLNGADADELDQLFAAGIEDDWYREHLGNPDQWDTDWIDPTGSR